VRLKNVTRRRTIYNKPTSRIANQARAVQQLNFLVLRHRSQGERLSSSHGASIETIAAPGAPAPTASPHAAAASKVEPILIPNYFCPV
jgi:hypothetical protein